ncbi:AbrB/MazE/SpoVT family DNA-binding domain-containing protein [bacterium]|nr:AbrB/MazE/SpoVT family DNA-binding domain-containing protein [bacterium]
MDVNRTILKVAEGGRIVIPAAVRERLGIDIGDEVILTLENDHATLMNARAARRKAQERIQKYIKPGVSLSKELLAERKAEARHE